MGEMHEIGEGMFILYHQQHNMLELYDIHTFGTIFLTKDMIYKIHEYMKGVEK